MWSGPRNISTALMRAFENRKDTKVFDEPFYAYYLNRTNLNHPMKEEILNKYPYEENEVINLITKEDNNYKIFYQKHMTHHILDKTSLDWINNGKNCFLIRDPGKVIVSYLKKNTLKTIQDVGYKKLYEIFKLLNSEEPIVINSDYLLEVFDRNGSIIFKSTDVNQGWNGKINGEGKVCSLGVYVWKISVKEAGTKKPYKFIGNITLLR